MSCNNFIYLVNRSTNRRGTAPISKKKKTQSPWDFPKYTESVVEEHARRSTTSVDYKISKALKERSAPLEQATADDSASSESEPDKQEDYRPEDDNDGDGDIGESKSFFAPSACIPLALTVHDICGSAITGSGKTAAFALPTLERFLFREKHMLAMRVLILTPTGEWQSSRKHEYTKRRDLLPPQKNLVQMEKEKKLAAKASMDKTKNSGKELISAQEDEDLKMKEKRKREPEKNMPRKKRRKLEAAREMLEDEDPTDKLQANGKNKKEKAGISLVDLAYQRAKAAKAVKRAADAGKILSKGKSKSSRPPRKTPSRTEEMRDLLQNDMSEKKQRGKVLEQERSPRIHLKASQGTSAGSL